MTIVVDRLSARRLPEHLSLVSHEGDLPRMCRLWLDVRADGLLPFAAVAEICELLALDMRVHDEAVRRGVTLESMLTVGPLLESASALFASGWRAFAVRAEADGEVTDESVARLRDAVRAATRDVERARALLKGEP